ncbi:MAG TPA: hypothetical protein VKU36_04570 [Candidatus Babeliales bacterium]|jgi:hypothetical protein|nr:hypothetical protein [Candidatus Babeliales bacterium]
MLHKLSRNQQGLICLIGGAALFLYALGVFGKGLNVVVVIFAAVIMVFGFMRMGLHKEIMDAVKKMKHRR